MSSKITANIQQISGPGIPLYVVFVSIPKVGSFCYRALKSRTDASAIAQRAVQADPYHLSMMLCSRGWTAAKQS